MNTGLRIARVLAFAGAVATATDAFAQGSDIMVENTGPEQSAAGRDVAYTVVLTNVGPDDSARVTLDEALPGSMTFVSRTQDSGPAFACSDPPPGFGGSISCSISGMAAGESAVFSFTLHIPAATPNGTRFTGIAAAACASDPNDENNSAVVSTSTPPPPTCDLGILKSGPGTIGTDEDLVYTLTITNAGPDAALNVVITDELPPELNFVSFQQTDGTPLVACSPTTCTVATFGAGDTVTLTLTGHVPAGTPFETLIRNTATVSSDTADANDENDTSTSGTTVGEISLDGELPPDADVPPDATSAPS